jgi:hypothetical protein
MQPLQPGEERRLYALRHPFTAILVRRIDRTFSDIAVEIDNHYAGTLRVKTEGLASTVMQIFANGVREVGMLTPGGVEWFVEPSIFGDQCISELGEVHDTNRF